MLSRRSIDFNGLGAPLLTSVGGSQAAEIRAEVQDPSPSGTAMGGRLILATSAQSTAVPADNVVIDNTVRLTRRD